MPRDHDPDERDRGFATRAIHGQALPPVDQDTPSVPIYQTSTFRFDTSDGFAETINFRRPGYTYTRGYGNPTLLAFERVMAELEGTESALSFASGMAAIHTVATTLAANGDTIVASDELYGGTYSLFAHVLPRYGIDVRFVDPHDPNAVRAALPGAAMLYVETIANPNVTVCRPGGARRARVGRRRPERGRQHVRVAVPVHAGVVRVRLRPALGDQVHRRPQRPDRRHRLHVRGADGRAPLHGDRDRGDAGPARGVAVDAGALDAAGPDGPPRDDGARAHRVAPAPPEDRGACTTRGSRPIRSTRSRGGCSLGGSAGWRRSRSWAASRPGSASATRSS